ncbi:MAG: hypothetical protein ACYSYV_09040 [Planctomycetota bacterium]|jgi:hypothetical protein
MTRTEKSRIVTGVVASLLLLAVFVSSSPAPEPPGPPPPPPPLNPGTGTPGYWKNHPEAWPVCEIAIGGVAYKKDEAISYMWCPVKGDKTITMFKALVAAKLNVCIGNDPRCIARAIVMADCWTRRFGPVGSEVKANSQAWKIGEPLYQRLDTYNNGQLCAPPRD